MHTASPEHLLPGLVRVMDHLSHDALKVYLHLRCGLGVDRTAHCSADAVTSLFDVNGPERGDNALVELLGKGLIIPVARGEKSVIHPITVFHLPELRPPLLPPSPRYWV